MAELRDRHDVAMEWLPYELRPEPAPLPRIDGPEGERFRENWQRGVAPLAERFGVEMHFPPFKPRSRRAHEAAELARERSLFEPMRTALFRAFFVDNRDLGEIDVLADVGASVGLDPAELRDALEAGRYTARVVELEGIAARVAISAVPTVVIGEPTSPGALAVAGVRPYDVLRRALEEAERRAGRPR